MLLGWRFSMRLAVDLPQTTPYLGASDHCIDGSVAVLSMPLRWGDRKNQRFRDISMTGKTLGVHQAAMEMKHFLIPRTLVQIINVLSNHRDTPSTAR